MEILGVPLEILLFFFALAVAAPLMGRYMAHVYCDRIILLHPIESVIYRICGVDEHQEMGWKEYLKALLFFNVLGFLFLFSILIFQDQLPFNPENFPGLSIDLAFNVAASFVTNTNWQSYAGETTLSYFSQMAGLTGQNFLSAATGMCAFVALARGIQKKQSGALGNFWVDLTRTLIYILLPLAIIFSLILVEEGVVQTLSPYAEVTPLEGDVQKIPLGPVASQVAIKQLGTNGGGFFNANSAHPFENPTRTSNFFEAFALLWIPAASLFTFGILIKDHKHALLLFWAMLILFFTGLAVALYAQELHSPLLPTPSLEGMEVRFGTANSILWAVSTTSSANGSVNAMLSSFSPLAGGIALFNILIGELIFGGVGVGMCSILMFTLLTVFLSGLMVGRTPQYMGKKIDKWDVQWVMAAVLIPGSLILIGTAISSVIPLALSGVSQKGPHGLTEILYAFASAAGNNGSAFAGLSANTIYYNLFLGIVMILGRLSILIPTLAIAGSLANKNIAPVTIGTFATDNFLFLTLLIGVILIVGALTFFPVLCLGPIIEHLLMLEGRFF